MAVMARATVMGAYLMSFGISHAQTLSEAGFTQPTIQNTVYVCEQQGVTVLLIEQNANMALKIADYAYVLETGNITKSGTGAELLADESIKEAYLGKKKS